MKSKLVKHRYSFLFTYSYKTSLRGLKGVLKAYNISTLVNLEMCNIYVFLVWLNGLQIIFYFYFSKTRKAILKYKKRTYLESIMLLEYQSNFSSSIFYFTNHNIHNTFSEHWRKQTFLRRKKEHIRRI